MSAVRLRNVESAHVADLIRIADRTNLNYWSADSLLCEIKNEHSIVRRLVSDSNETFGFILGRVVPAADDALAVDAEIYNIGILPRLQRSGHGQSLLDEFTAECRLRHVRSVWLEVRESNAPAVSFYMRNGFLPITIRKDFYADPRENAILMRLWLAPATKPVLNA